MNKGQQDKNWEELGSEGQKEVLERYKFISEKPKSPEREGYLQGVANVFGAHNLQPKPLTYAGVAKELFKGGAYSPACNTALFEFKRNPVEEFVLNCTTPKQANKLLAINKLLNVAKYLNGDWKPDWSNKDELNNKIWCLGIDENKIRAYYVDLFGARAEFVYFRTKELAQQALQILGEETIRLALSTDY